MNHWNDNGTLEPFFLSGEFCSLLKTLLIMGRSRTDSALHFSYIYGFDLSESVWFFLFQKEPYLPATLFRVWNAVPWCSFSVWMKTMRKGSVEAWNLSWCLTGHWGEVRFSCAVRGRKHERGLLALNFFEPLCWNLPQFATQTLTTPLGGAAHHAGAGYTKMMPVCRENQESTESWKFHLQGKCWARGTQRLQRRRGQTLLPCAARVGWSGSPWQGR